MKLILKYLKPYILLVIVCILLLFGQAMCDLSLPNLMSDIVNVGIQYNGIDQSAPDVISAQDMQLMRLFMTDSDYAQIDKRYAFKKAGEAGASVLKKFPNASSTDVYVLDGKPDEELGIIFGRSAMTMMLYLKAQNPEVSQSSESTADGLKDISQFYPLLSIPSDSPELAAAKAAAAELDSYALDMAGPVMVRQFYAGLGADTDAIRTKYVLFTGLKMLLLTLLGAFLTIMVSLIAARTSAGVAMHLRKDVFSKVEKFSSAEFDKFSTASLITRTTNDVTQVQQVLVMMIRMIFYAPIMGIGGVIMAVRKSVALSWIIALAVGVLLLLICVVFFVAMPKFKLVQKQVDRLNLVTRESLTGIMVIRAFGTQKFEESRFEQANAQLTKTNLFVNRVMVIMMPVMMFIMNGVSLLIMWFGAKQIEASAIQVGDMMAYIQYSMQVIMSFLMIGMMFIMVPRSIVSANRIAEVLDTEPSINDPKAPKTLAGKVSAGKVSGEICFDKVSFRYDGAEEDVLHDISFTARPGQTTAFIGSTGSGKSTLVNLIPRFYDVTQGRILYDGIDIRELTQHELHSLIGYVPQKGVLFSGDIASNLAYGRNDASEEELRTAAEIAQATEFIDASPEGLSREISQGGSNVSGGQKQRLSIGRAIAKRPPVYIFDDSFSALDFKTDAALRRALAEHTGDATVLIVAQRVGTIMNADNIIVLDEGRIVGHGTHSELLKSCETYREIASSQLSEEELAGEVDTHE